MKLFIAMAFVLFVGEDVHIDERTDERLSFAAQNDRVLEFVFSGSFVCNK